MATKPRQNFTFDIAFLDGMHLFEFLLRMGDNTLVLGHRVQLQDPAAVHVHDAHALQGRQVLGEGLGRQARHAGEALVGELQLPTPTAYA